MSDLLLLLIISNVFFGMLAILFSRKEEYAKRQLLQQEHKLAKKRYETVILNLLYEEVGYSLNIQKLIEAIIGNIGNLLPYSMISYVVVSESRLTAKFFIKESVNQEFI